MNFTPAALYHKAVAAVPSLRYALGVSGVIATATIAYNFATNDPLKAVLLFVFTLAGMYLLLIFATFVADNPEYVNKVLRGPALAVIWTITILFILLLIFSLSSFVIGWPSAIAQLLRTTPVELRVASATGNELPVKPVSRRETAPAAASPAPTAVQKAPLAMQAVQEEFRISDSSEDCGVDRTQTLKYCLASPTKLIGWKGPQIESANCGSTISNIRRPSEQENCIAVDVQLKGCGYDEFVLARNCRGRGWIGGSVILNGEKPAI